MSQSEEGVVDVHEEEGRARVIELARAIEEGDDERARRLAIEGVSWLNGVRGITTVDDFTEVPVSVGEVRSDRSNRAGDWTPRDALVSMLRDIDSGKRSPTELMIVTVEKGEDGADVRYLRAGPADQWQTAGYLEQIKGQLLGFC